MGTLFLSVIVCTYNRARLLAKCLDSLTEQQLSPDAFEVIVVDNNCTDGTKELVAQYNTKIRNLKYVLETTQGLSDARNRGCIETSAEYLAYLDDDAIAPPEYLVNITHVIKEYSPDITGGPVYPYYTTPKPRWFKDEYETRKYEETSGFSTKCGISGSNFIIKKSLLKKLGMFDVALGLKPNEIGGTGAERKVVELYRAITPQAEQKVYYALEIYVKHYVPKRNMTFWYRMKRNYRSGRGTVRALNRGPEYAVEAITTLIRHVYREIKKHGLMKVDYIRIAGMIVLRSANVLEVFKQHGFKAVVGPVFRSLLRSLRRRLLPWLGNKTGNSGSSGIRTSKSSAPRVKAKKVKILWLIEHIAREMDVACAVKYLAKTRYGLDIEIKHVYLDTTNILNNYRPEIIALPFFYNVEALAVKDYVERWPSAIYLNLAWEEIFYKGHVKIKAPTDDFTRQKVFHHAWGNFFKQYLVENGVRENNVFLNGNPAFELYLNPYNKYYPDRKWLAQKYKLDINKRWIIVPENYRWAFINDGTINLRASQGMERNELLGMRQFARESLRLLLEWCNDAAKNDRLEIIFRPKPATMLTEMEDFFNEHVDKVRSDGLHFIKGESVREWILGSDVVISSFSTTLIEAAIAGRPAYMVEPIPLTESFEADWYEYVPRIRTADEFHAACVEKSSQGPSHLKAWAENDMLANGDPISNLADFLYDLAQKPPVPVGLRTKLLGWYRRTRYPYRKAYFNPRTHENDSFDENYVNQKVEEWGKVLLNYKT